MLELFLINLAVTLGLLTLVWTLSIVLEDVGIIDIFWGIGFVVIAWVTFLQVEDRSLQSILIPVLTSIWGLRLATHLAFRNIGKPEDKRYAKMRSHNPDTFWWRSYFTVFMLQGVILCVVSLPLQVGIRIAGPEWNAWHVMGTVIWAIGLFFEAVGDWQLAAFKAKPENDGKVLDSGLWRYTRHPNYFGDFLVWWGFFVICLACGGGWWTIISPIIMSIFLMAISGVTMTENSMKEEKPQYADYIERTNRFFPGLPKSS